MYISFRVNKKVVWYAVSGGNNYRKFSHKIFNSTKIVRFQRTPNVRQAMRVNHEQARMNVPRQKSGPLTDIY